MQHGYIAKPTIRHQVKRLRIPNPITRNLVIYLVVYVIYRVGASRDMVNALEIMYIQTGMSVLITRLFIIHSYPGRYISVIRLGSFGIVHYSLSSMNRDDPI